MKLLPKVKPKPVCACCGSPLSAAAGYCPTCRQSLSNCHYCGLNPNPLSTCSECITCLFEKESSS